MATKKPQIRSMVVDVPEELAMRVVKSAREEQLTTREWLSKRVVEMLSDG